MQGCDVLIVGGGAIGCAIAYFVAKEGAKTLLLERGEVAGEASGASAGMLAPLAEAKGPGPFLELGLRSLEMFPTLAQELFGLTGIDIGYSQAGILRVAFTPHEQAELRSKQRWQRALGVELLDGEGVRLLEPRLSPHVSLATFSPREGQVEAGRFTQALAQAAQRLGTQLHLGTEALGLVHQKKRVVGVRTRQGTLWADHIVLAMGAWTGRFLRRLDLPVATPPVRGQMLAYRGHWVRHIVWGGGGYLVPKGSGFTFVGATVERVGFRPHTTKRGIRFLRQVAARLIPALRGAETASSWAGLRPGSPDDLPIMGRAPGWERLWVACGHFRNGILLAPITGATLARAILKDEEVGLLAPFSPGRFSSSP